MKLINTANGEIIADITTNHSMSIDDILSLMKYTVDGESGEIYDDGKPLNAFYDDLDITADCPVYEVYTVALNKDGSPNNEILEGEYTDKSEALKKAEQTGGEVRQYINDTDYNIIR